MLFLIGGELFIKIGLRFERTIRKILDQITGYQSRCAAGSKQERRDQRVPVTDSIGVNHGARNGRGSYAKGPLLPRLPEAKRVSFEQRIVNLETTPMRLVVCSRLPHRYSGYRQMTFVPDSNFIVSRRVGTVARCSECCWHGDTGQNPKSDRAW